MPGFVLLCILPMNVNLDIARIRNDRAGRVSSWDAIGRNNDAWIIPAGESRVLANIEGPGAITHIWMTQAMGYREVLLRFYWDGARFPSINVPLGDFFGLGHSIVNSYQSLLFSASTEANGQFNQGCALNCYVPMPFKKSARVELVNESSSDHRQYFHIDYASLPPEEHQAELGYFHTEFRRTNPFGGWGHEVLVNTSEANIVNEGRTAWENNYVILETSGRGHYIGCNLSVTNL